jgi:hypothetical protein
MAIEGKGTKLYMCGRPITIVYQSSLALTLGSVFHLSVPSFRGSVGKGGFWKIYEYHIPSFPVP